MLILRDSVLDDERLLNTFGFVTAHIFIEDKVRNFHAIQNSINKQIEFIVDQSFLYGSKHCILCLIHHRDYVIRDWRSIPVFPILYNYVNSIKSCNYLSSITMVDMAKSCRRRSITEGTNRPFFPLRCTVECSLFMVKRDCNGTYDKWFSEKSIESRKLNFWRYSPVFGSDDTPDAYCYKGIIELLCHPDKPIYDIFPHNGGFAVAASMLDRGYIGVYRDARTKANVSRRLHILKGVKK